MYDRINDYLSISEYEMKYMHKLWLHFSGVSTTMERKCNFYDIFIGCTESTTSNEASENNFIEMTFLLECMLDIPDYIYFTTSIAVLQQAEPPRVASLVSRTVQIQYDIWWYYLFKCNFGILICILTTQFKISKLYIGCILSASMFKVITSIIL